MVLVRSLVVLQVVVGGTVVAALVNVNEFRHDSAASTAVLADLRLEQGRLLLAFDASVHTVIVMTTHTRRVVKSLVAVVDAVRALGELVGQLLVARLAVGVGAALVVRGPRGALGRRHGDVLCSLFVVPLLKGVFVEVDWPSVRCSVVPAGSLRRVLLQHLVYAGDLGALGQVVESLRCQKLIDEAVVPLPEIEFFDLVFDAGQLLVVVVSAVAVVVAIAAHGRHILTVLAFHFVRKRLHYFVVPVHVVSLRASLWSVLRRKHLAIVDDGTGGGCPGIDV